MTLRHSIVAAIGALCATVACQNTPGASTTPATPAIDRDLMDVTVPGLQRLYADKKYTVTQVVRWHLDRIDRYNGVYGAIETVLRERSYATVPLRRILEILESSGSIARAQERARSFAEKARGIMLQFPYSPYQRALTAVTDLVTDRDH